MRTNGLRDVLLAADVEARGESDGILDGLGSAVTGRRKERVGAVTDLDDTGTRRSPAWLRVSPQELEVDDGLLWCAADKILEDRSPLHWARNLVHAHEHLLGLDGVVPGLCLRSGCLFRYQPQVATRNN